MDLEKRTQIPNSLEEHWMPFTSNRDYKENPRLMVKAEGVYYTDHYGNKLIDASSGLFCSPAGHSRPEIRDALFIARAQDHYKFNDDEFDLVISLGCLHNLRIFELQIALSEIERVGKQGYIMLESYRNEQEQFNLQCWALTCESFFDHEEWPWIYNHFGFTGDYEFIYFE